MEVLTNFFTFALSFLAVLTVVVFIHELGHFLVARWCGVKVKAFSIGFGREIFGFDDKHGTRWRFAWIPLGGYVKFMDDDGAASTPSRETIAQMTEEQKAGSFHLKPVWKRAAVVAAGPAANFLLAIFIFSAMFMTVGVTKLQPRIGEVVADTPAAAAGFKAGDIIKSINGRDIDDFLTLQHIVSTSPERALEMEIERNGVIQTLTVRPELREQNDAVAGKHKRAIIGIRSARDETTLTHERVGPLTAIAMGSQRTWDLTTGTLAYLGDIVVGRQDASQLGGPIRIADVSGKVAQLGLDNLVRLIALISVSVGLINLFPVPLLDGGHLMFYAIEAIRGRPLGEKTQEIGYRVGLALVLALMVFATFNDLPIVERWLSNLG